MPHDQGTIPVQDNPQQSPKKVPLQVHTRRKEMTLTDHLEATTQNTDDYSTRSLVVLTTFFYRNIWTSCVASSSLELELTSTSPSSGLFLFPPASRSRASKHTDMKSSTMDVCVCLLVVLFACVPQCLA